MDPIHYNSEIDRMIDEAFVILNEISPPPAPAAEPLEAHAPKEPVPAPRPRVVVIAPGPPRVLPHRSARAKAQIRLRALPRERPADGNSRASAARAAKRARYVPLEYDAPPPIPATAPLMLRFGWVNPPEYIDLTIETEDER